MSHTPTSQPDTPAAAPRREPTADELRIAREKQLHAAQRAENRRKHQRAGGRDMVLSLAVILVPVLLICWWFTRTPDRPPVTPVDVVAATQQARSEAHMPIWVPTAMPGKWVPVRADWAPANTDLLGHGTMPADTWVMGYQSPDEHYYELDEQQGSTPHFVPDFTHSANASGTVQLNGTTWTRYQRKDGTERYLVRTENAKGSTTPRDTLIVASARSFDELAAFATSLSSTAVPIH